jgi:hypothetical protein
LERLVSIKRWFAKAFLLAVLELGALTGVPVRPEEIEAVMHATKVTESLRQHARKSEGDDPLE